MNSQHSGAPTLPLKDQLIRSFPLDLRIAIAIALCLLTYLFVPELQVLAACTSALMCVQDSGSASFKSSLTRLLTTLIGGVVALGIVVLDNGIGNYPVFIGLCLVGIVITLTLCRLCRVPPIAGRIGCITFILVVIVASGAGRIPYALHRVLASAYGALCACAVAYVWDWIAKLTHKA